MTALVQVAATGAPDPPAANQFVAAHPLTFDEIVAALKVYPVPVLTIEAIAASSMCPYSPETVQAVAYLFLDLAKMHLLYVNGDPDTVAAFDRLKHSRWVGEEPYCTVFIDIPDGNTPEHELVLEFMRDHERAKAGSLHARLNGLLPAGFVFVHDFHECCMMATAPANAEF